MTIAVVRLSSTDDRKKVIKLTAHSKTTGLLVFKRLVITLKPSCASTTSTMVMAPNKKNRMPAISLTCSNNKGSAWWMSAPPKM